MHCMRAIDGESDGLVGGCHCIRIVHIASTASASPDRVFRVIMNASDVFGRFTTLAKRLVHWKHQAIIASPSAACNHVLIEKTDLR